MNHYERLGVARDADVATIHAAYLRAARAAHPDVVGEAADSDDMVAINHAWQELSDPDRRTDYNLTLTMGAPTSWKGATSGGRPVVSPTPEEEFRPFDPRDVDESFRYSEDEGDPATATGRGLAMVPALLFVVAVVVGLLGMILRSDAVIGAAVVTLAGAAVSVVAVPMVVMGRAVRSEDRHRS